MDSGIYALFWEEQDLIYVGQSQSLTRRYAEHIKNLEIDKHSNYKVQEAYNSYGLPIFIVLEYAKITELNTLEISWQKEFNSLSSLDIIYAGDVGYGAYSNASKYSIITLYRVFISLYSNSKRTLQEISIKCNVDYSLVKDIYGGNSHLWLKEKYPVKYAQMQSINYKSMAHWGIRCRNYMNIVSPTGEVFIIENSVLNTAKKIKEKYYPIDNDEVIRKGISRVLSNKRVSWRGWKLEVIN